MIGIVNIWPNTTSPRKKLRKFARENTNQSKVTASGRRLSIVLSPEDNDLQPYGEGNYYIITAFETKKEL